MTEKDDTLEQKPKKAQSWTKTTETGAFIRTTYRKGNKRKTNTKKITKNQKKVILGRIGEFEVYVYPFDFPDTVFIGKFPISIQIDSSNVNSMLSCYNRAKWYLNGEAFSEPNNRKGANSRRRSIQRAYNHALNEQRRKK